MSRVGTWVVLALVAGAPWYFGGVESDAQFWFHVAAAVALVFAVAVPSRSGEDRMAIPWVVLLLGGGLLLGGAQLVPGVMRNNAAQQLRRELTAPSPNASSESHEEQQPASLYPVSTRRDVVLLVLGTGAFLLGVFYFQSPRDFVILCRIMSLNGAALALFGILQSMRWNGKLYWVLPIEHGSPFGPFVYRNQAGDFLALCLAGAAGWVVHAFRSPQAEEGQLPLSSRLADIVVDLNLMKLAAVGALVLNIVGVMASMSRGAMVSVAIAVACLFVGWAMARAVSLGRQLLLVTSLAASLIVLVWAGLTPNLTGRFVSLVDRDWDSGESRLVHWEQGWKTAQQYWPWGSGLGTYRYAYRAHETHFNKQWFHHAHNQYLEAVVDGGAPAITLLLLALTAMGICLFRLWRAERFSGQLFATVGALAVISQALHSTIDFCLYLSANMVLFAVVCGAVAGRAASLFPAMSFPLPGWLRRCVPLACAGGLVWGAFETRHNSDIDRALAQLPWKKTSFSLTENELTEHIQGLNAIVHRDEAEVHEALAELWIHLYRVRARKQLSDELKVPLKDPNLWEWTSPVVLYSRAHELAGDAAALTDLRDQPAVQQNLRPALEHLYLAREGCPLLPRVHLHLAELSFLEAEFEADKVHLSRVVRTASGSPSLWYEVGRLNFASQRLPEAFRAWQKSLELHDEFREDVLRLAATKLNEREIVDRLLPHAPRSLLRIASALEKDRENLRQQCLLQARSLLTKDELVSAERYFLLGQVNAMEGRHQDAIQEYTRAVEENPKEVDWRFELAKLLLETERLEEAKREARKCLWMNPNRSDFQNLLMEIDRAERRNRSSRGNK